MTRAKKIILALICAAALCCAAIGGVLLARSPAQAAEGDVTALEIVIPDGTRFYVFEDLEDVENKITVNATYEGGGTDVELDPDDFVLSVVGRDDMTDTNGVTFGDNASGNYTIVATPAAGVAVSPGFEAPQMQIEVRVDEVTGISAVYTPGSPVYQYTTFTSLRSSIQVSLVYASGNTETTQDYTLSGDLSAPAQINGDTYDKNLTVTYNGQNFAGAESDRSCTVTITGINAADPVLVYYEGDPLTGRSGDEFETVAEGLVFTVSYGSRSNSNVRWDDTKFDWYYTTYDEDSGEYSVVTDNSKTAMDWATSSNGTEMIVFTYTEAGVTIPLSTDEEAEIVEIDGTKYYFIEVALLRESYPELPIVTEYGTYSYNQSVADLPYKYDAADNVGIAQTVTLGTEQYPFDYENVSITSVIYQPAPGGSQDITTDAVVLQGGVQTGGLLLTEVGTYTITLSLINDMYYWRDAGENGSLDIVYTVTIVPSELDLGISFTGTTLNDAGAPKSGWTYGDSIDSSTNGVLSVGDRTVLSVTGNYGGGTVTYHFLSSEGADLGTNLPTNAGNYYVYISVAASADGRFAASSMDPGDGTSYTEWAVPFIIGKQQVAPYTETTPASDGGQTVFDYKAYTGGTLTADENDPSGRYSIVTNAGGIGVGSYDVVLQLSDSDNYRWSGKTSAGLSGDFDNSADFAQTTVTFRIIRAENADPSVSISGWTYGDPASTPTPGFTFGTPTYTYYRVTEAGREQVEDITNAGAGEYVVVATVELTDNYGTYSNGNWGNTVAEDTFTIARQSVARPTLESDPNVEYNYGLDVSAPITHIAGDDWNNYYNVTNQTATAVGPVYSVVTLNGNYQWSTGENTTESITLIWNVVARTITVPTGSDPNMTYDGGAKTYTFGNWTGLTNSISPFRITVRANTDVTSSATIDYSAGTVSLTNAGVYTITVSLSDTTNFAWSGTAPAGFTFTINKASISPSVTINGQGDGAAWDYDGLNKEVAVGGNPGNGNVEYSYAGRNNTSYGGNTQPKDAGEYTLTATIAETDNYLGGTASISFTIHQKAVEVGFVSGSYSYTGTLITVELTVDGNGVDLSDNEYFTVVSGASGTDADTYTVTIAWKNNYKSTAQTGDNFTTGTRTTTVGTWEITPYEVTLPEELVNATEFSYNASYAGVQQTWLWDNFNGFGVSGLVEAPFTVGVTASGSGIAEGSYGYQANEDTTGSGYLFATEAGSYTFTLSLTSTQNFVWAGTDDTSDKTLTWTISKAEESIPDLGTARQLEYDGTAKAPSAIIDITNNTVPSNYTGLYTFVEYRGESGSVVTDNGGKPANRGTYYVVIQLVDPDNFAWTITDDAEDTLGSGNVDIIDGAQLSVIYQITGTSYTLQVTNVGSWTYGTQTSGEVKIPVVNSTDGTSLAAAIADGATITYTYQIYTNGAWSAVDGYTFSYTSADPNYNLTVVPTDAGLYQLVVEVTASTINQNFASSRITSEEFTVSPYTLTEEDIVWSNPSLTYKGSAYTYGTDAGRDVYAQYYTYTYTNGRYERSSSADAFLQLELTTGSDALTNAGDYTFTASVSGNYTLPNNLSTNTYTISQVMLTVKADDKEVTYGSDAPAYTVTITGFVNDETINDLDTLPVATSRYTNQTGVGTVQITVSGGADNNYAFPTYDTENYGTLTVKPADLTVSVNPTVSRDYDGNAHSLSRNGNNSIFTDIVTGESSVNNQDIIWKFATQPFDENGNITNSGSEIGNVRDVANSGTIYYYVSAANHSPLFGDERCFTLTIDKVALTLTANDISVVYGEDINYDTSLNSYTAQVAGLDSNELLGTDTKERVLGAFAPSYQAYVVAGDTYSAGDDVTSSGWVQFSCSAPNLANYTVTFANGTLTVTPRAITVSIADKTQQYGDRAVDLTADVTLTSTGATGTAIFNGDTGVYTLSVYERLADGSYRQISPGSTTNAGVYYIVGSSDDANYTVTFTGSADYDGEADIAGTYTVRPRSLTVDYTPPTDLTYNGQPKVYTAVGQYTPSGSSEPQTISFTVYYLGVNGTEYDDGNGAPTTQAPINQGTYQITVVSNDPNFENANLPSTTMTITPYQITAINWDLPTLVYDGTNQSAKIEGTATYTNVFGESVTLSVSADAAMTNATSYILTARFAEEDNGQGNYVLATAVTNTITINPRPIVVTIADIAVEYGDVAFADIAGTLTAASISWDSRSSFIDDGKGGIVDNATPYELYLGSGAGANESGYLNVWSGGYLILGRDVESGVNNYDIRFASENGEATTGVYTVNPRAVTISFAQDVYTAVYGTPVSELTHIPNGIWYRRTELEGNAFVGNDSITSVVGASGVSVISRWSSGTAASGRYSETAPAGSVWELFLRVGNTEESTLTVGNYAFSFADTATLTVLQRQITVTIEDVTNLTYGTDEVAKAQLTATEALADGSDGTAIVNGDTNVYSLAVYDKNGNVVVYGTTTPAGDYFIVGAAENDNYDITFIGSCDYNDAPGIAGLFQIVNNDEGITVTISNNGAQVPFKGSAYYLLNEDGTLGDLANTLGIIAAADNADWSGGNPFLWEFRLNGDVITSLTHVKEGGGAYTVNYTVSLPEIPSYTSGTGSFTVEITQAENEWTSEYSHEGWSYKGIEGDSINPVFTTLDPTVVPVAAFGTEEIEYNYYRTRTSGDAGNYVYSDQIVDPVSFFNNDTLAGTYYVQVSISETDDYAGLTFDGTIVVAQHILSVRWAQRNVEQGVTQNTLQNYDAALMSVNDYSTELTIGTADDQNKTLSVSFADTISGTFYVTLELEDSDNYDWANPLTSNATLCRVSFSVAVANNRVTITVTDWTYGDNTIIALPGEAGSGAQIAIDAEYVPNGDNSNVLIAFANDRSGTTEDNAGDLNYSISTLPTDAGTYWIRVLVLGDNTHGMGEAYAKFTIAKYQVTAPTVGTLLGEESATYNGNTHTFIPTLAGGFVWDSNYARAVLELPNGEQVVLLVSGNRAINADGYQASVSLEDLSNTVWSGGSTEDVTLSWQIARQSVARPYFVDKEGDHVTTITTKYGEDEDNLQQMHGFDAVTMGFAGATVGASYYADATGSYLRAIDVGSYSITIDLKDAGNYQWADGEEEDTVLTWVIEKAVFDDESIGYEQEVYEFTYNGTQQYPTLENIPLGVRVESYTFVHEEDGINAYGSEYEGEECGVYTITATLRLVGSYEDNYEFEDGQTTLQVQATVIIRKAEITDVSWTVQDHYTYNGDDQSDSIHAYYSRIDDFNLYTLEIEPVEGDFVGYREGGYTFRVVGISHEGEGWQNYTLGSNTFTKTYYIDKLPVYIVVGEATGDHVYDGQRPTLAEYGFEKVAVYGSDGQDLRDDFIMHYDEADWTANMRFALLDADGNAPSAWNVGSYTVTVTGADALQNYSVTNIFTAQLQIVPKEITISQITSLGATFGSVDPAADGATVEAANVVGMVDGEDFTNALGQFLQYTYTGTAYDGTALTGGALTADIHAGNYTVTVSLAAGSNYVLVGSVSTSYEVSRMLVDPNLVEIDELPYTGAQQVLAYEDTRFTGTGSEYGLFAYTISAESGTDVGGYRVTLIIDNENYLWQSSVAGYGNMTADRTWYIVEAEEGDIVVSLPQVSVTDWGATAASVTVSGSQATIGGTPISVTISYLFEVKDGNTWVEFTGGVWNAGEYRVRAEAVSDNFPTAYSDYEEFTVRAGVYDVNGLVWADDTVTYDGDAHNLVLTVNGSAAAGGSIAGSALGATGTVGYTLSESKTAAGTYTMTVTLTAGDNYTFDGGETTLRKQAQLTIDEFTVELQWAQVSFTFDGTDRSDQIAAYFIGEDNRRIDLAVQLQSSEAFVNAGDYTFAVVGVQTQGVDLGNYKLAAGDILGAEQTYTIAQYRAAVVWPQTSFTYNGQDQFGSVQPYFEGLNGEQVALTVEAQTFRDYREGSYTFVVAGTSAVGIDLKNYALSNTEAVLSIAKLPVTVTADDVSVALNAPEEALTWSSTSDIFDADAAAGRVTVTLTRAAGTAAGMYDIYVQVTGDGAENFALTLVGGTYTIREQAITLVIDLPEDLVYDGNAKEAVLSLEDGEAVPVGITLWYEGTDNAGNAYASASAPVNAGSYTVSVVIATHDYDVSNPNISVAMVIGRAEAVIDVSGMQTQYTYTGAQQRVESGAQLSHNEAQLVYSNNIFTAVAEGDGMVVRIDAPETCNYMAAHAEVTIAVAKAAISPSVSVSGWTYGQTANGYTVSGNPGGGAVQAVYSGTTNAGAAYSSAQAPSEAGSYTLTVTVAETDNYLGGSAAASFTVARASLRVSVSIEGWVYGEAPNSFTVSPAGMANSIASVLYEGAGYSGSEPPTAVGSYTLTVTFAQTANYAAGSASDTFSITNATILPGTASVHIDGWTYGDLPNQPSVSGAPAGANITYRYTGTANDGTAWNSETAPVKAGSYTVTATISASGYTTAVVSDDFTVARRLLTIPTLGDTGERTASAVYDGEQLTIAVTGFEQETMNFDAAAGVQFALENGVLTLVADAEGTYTLTVSLKDMYNYGWADPAEGESVTADIVLTWEVELQMHSLLWLIILLIILILLLVIVLIVLCKKNHDAKARIAAAQGENNNPENEARRQNYALAPAGLLFAVPVWQTSLIAALAVIAVALLVADIVLLVRWRKHTKEAARAEEAPAAQSEEAAQELPADAEAAQSSTQQTGGNEPYDM